MRGEVGADGGGCGFGIHSAGSGLLALLSNLVGLPNRPWIGGDTGPALELSPPLPP